MKIRMNQCSSHGAHGPGKALLGLSNGEPKLWVCLHELIGWFSFDLDGVAPFPYAAATV